MTCPVPREMSDSERILKWLGYYVNRRNQYEKEVALGDMTFHIDLPIVATGGASAGPDDLDIICFLPGGETGALPQLDYLVLEKVRGLDSATQATFALMIKHLWYARDQVTHWRIAYLPGDYAEAARFLWEGE